MSTPSPSATNARAFAVLVAVASRVMAEATSRPPVGAVPHAALRICADCPVRTECLTHALAGRDIAFGVLGGLTANQRRKLLPARDANTRRTRRAA